MPIFTTCIDIDTTNYKPIFVLSNSGMCINYRVSLGVLDKNYVKPHFMSAFTKYIIIQTIKA